MKDIIYKSIQSLPPLPKALHELQQLCNDPLVETEKIALTIELDPILTVNFLKTISSPLYGLKKIITDVRQGIALVGIKNVYEILASGSIRRLLNADMDAYHTTAYEYIARCSQQALLLKLWYQKASFSITNELYLATLVQDIGKIIISQQIIHQKKVAEFQSAIIANCNTATVEAMFLDGETSSVISAAILKHWGFDSNITEVIKYADNPLLAKEPTIQKLSHILNIIKTAVPSHIPINEGCIMIALKKASDMGCNHKILEDCIDELCDVK